MYLTIVFSLPETLRSLVGNGAAVAGQPWISMPKFQTKPAEELDSKKFPKPPRPSLKKFMQLLKYPPHLIVSFNGAFQFAGLYAMYITFPKVWQKEFGWSAAEVGYAYLVPGISTFVASIVVGRLSDWLRKKAAANSPEGKIAPERRIAIQITGFIIGAAGKFMYGWFSERHVHPVGGLFGSALAAVGMAIIFVTGTSFQTECDPSQAAILVALGGFLRNVAAAIAAVIMDGLVRGMGYGWTFFGLGLLDLLCIPGIILIMVKGAHYRQRLQQKMQG